MVLGRIRFASTFSFFRSGEQVDQVFVQEAVICRQISHPNLLPFLGIHNLDSRICLVSPWLENGNIMNFLKRAPDADHTKLVSSECVTIYECVTFKASGPRSCIWH